MNNWHADPLIDEALTIACTRFPYYASPLLRLKIVADANVSTMATSAAWVTHYNPATVQGWTPDERADVLVHEVEHLLRRHHERCGDRDHRAFNVAGDAEINQHLNHLPDGAVTPASIGMPNGRTAEVYYAATGKQQPEQEPGDGSGDGDPGDGEPGDGDPGEPDPSGQQPGDCGSAAGGPARDYEQGDYNPQVADDATADAVRKDAARSVLNPGRGTDPGDELRDWARAELDIDRAAWYTALASAVGGASASFGYPARWSWPGRRDAADMGGAILPRWTGERARGVVIIDTSGSIGPEDMDMARAAADFVARVADVTFIGCDTHAVDLGNRLPDTIPGGGGTDLREGIAMAEKQGAKVIVIITDADTPWPNYAPSAPVVIGLNANGRPSYCPEWAKVVPVVREQ